MRLAKLKEEKNRLLVARASIEAALEVKRAGKANGSARMQEATPSANIQI